MGLRETIEAQVAAVMPGVEVELRRDGLAPTDERGRSFEVAADGLSVRFKPGTSYADWAADTLALIRMSEGSIWCAADAIAYGEATFGEAYAQVLEETTYTYETLKTAVWVARKFPPERRRHGIGITLFRAIASLPLPEQERILDEIQEEHLPRVEVEARARLVKRRLIREEAEAKGVPRVDDPDCVIVEGDALHLELPDESLELIVTSPPYGLDKPYLGLDPAEGWYALMSGFCQEMARVLVPGGRAAINVPIDTTRGAPPGLSRPTLADMTFALVDAGLSYKATIVWDEGNVSRQVARGSVDSPASPHLIVPAEAIVICTKGPTWSRPSHGKSWDISHEEWLAWTNGRWSVPGESHAWEGFEAAWPITIPRRLIKLLSFREDRVCDPFLGSGTSAIAALECGRTFYGVDADPAAVASARRRVAAAHGLLPARATRAT